MKNSSAAKIEAAKTRYRGFKDAAERGYRQHSEDFRTLEEAYNGVIDEGQRTSLKKRRKATLQIQAIKPKVNKVVREIMKSFFGGDELAKITQDGDNQEEVIKALTEELKDYARDEKFYSLCKPGIRNCLVYGTSITKVYWANNNPRIEHCLLSDVWLDPNAKGPDDIRFLVHRITSLTILDWKAWYKMRYDAAKEDPTRDLGMETLSPNKIEWKNYSGAQNQSVAADGDIGDYRRPEVFEIYRVVQGKWFVSTMLEDEVFLRVDEPLKDGNPFIIPNIEPQFVGITETPVRAYGAPFIEPLISIQKEYVIRRNQQVDAIDMQLNQRLLTTATSGLREDDLNSTRKKIVVTDPKAVVPLLTPTIREAMFDTDKLEAEMQEISGITKYSQGLADKANLNQTATGMSILAQEGSSTIDDINRAINEGYFRPLMVKIINMLYKYKESERFANVSRSEPLRAKVIIDVGIGSTNKELQLQALDNTIVGVERVIEQFSAMMQFNPEAALTVTKYAKALNELNREKIKLLGFNSIMEEIDNEFNEQEQIAALGGPGALPGSIPGALPGGIPGGNPGGAPGQQTF